MLDYIYRLARDFEKAHGFNPNLLYLNADHAQHLKLSFDGSLTQQQIKQWLGMEVIIAQDIVHPHVCWVHYAERIAC